MAKTLYCINNWVNDPSCCGGTKGSNFFLGVKIVDGIHTYWHEQPFHAIVQKGKLILTYFKYDGQNKSYHATDTYYISEFNQSEAEIKEIIKKCITGQFQNSIIRKPALNYIVNDGDQSLFLCPKNADESYLSIEYYTVFRDGQELEQGTGEFQYILDGGDVFLTVPIPDITPSQDPYVITIIYWVLK